MTYPTAALGHAEPGLGFVTRRLLDATYVPGPIETRAALSEEIENTFGNEIVLVLDDYHVNREPLIHDAIAFVLDHLPSRVRLLVSGRDDPASPLARLRARNQLTEFRVDDLRVSTDAPAALLGDLTGEALNESDVSTLRLESKAGRLAWCSPGCRSRDVLTAPH